jgi:hypothetical protein
VENPDETRQGLSELIALADDPSALSTAIINVDGLVAAELLLGAVMLLGAVSEQVALGDELREGEPEPEESEPGDGELTVEDPWRSESPGAATLERARQLREALCSQRNLAGLRGALSALTDEECVSICFELGLNALALRRPGGEEGDDR